MSSRQKIEGHFSCRVLMFLVGVALPLAAMAQDEDFSKITIKTEKLGANLYMLSGVGGFAGGNVGVLAGDDGVLLVDVLLEPLAPKLKAALAAITAKPVRFVLNTHDHNDHTDGNKIFGLTATVIAHENTRTALAATDDFDGSGKRAPKQVLPVLTYDGRLTLHLNGEEVRGFHFPAAHTNGDTVVQFVNAKVMHLGDNFFNGMYPFIGKGGSVQGMLALLDKVLADLPAGSKIIPGHGPLASRADLAAYVTMLRETSTIVERGLLQGKTAEQLQ
ncbi:MAG: MBL fold metallo-hydrolase, partial [bacterium]